MPTPRIIADRRGSSATETSRMFPVGALEQLSRDELLETLRRIFTILDSNHGASTRSRSAQDTCRLSSREYMVLLWMTEGKTNWEISQILKLRERTVRYHVARVFEKLEVTSRAQAIARAMGAGLIG